MEKYNVNDDFFYFWIVSSKYPNSYWLKYDWENNPNYLEFKENVRIPNSESIILKFSLNEKVKTLSFLKYDYFKSDALPLVSERFANLIKKYASDTIQFIKAYIFQSEQKIAEVFVPVFLLKKDIIDKKLSVFDEELEDYTKIYLNKGFIINENIFMVEKYIVVREDFVKDCEKNKIKGVDFYKEPFENPLYIR